MLKGWGTGYSVVVIYREKNDGYKETKDTLKSEDSDKIRVLKAPLNPKIMYVSVFFGYFVPGGSPTFFGLGRGPITPPDPAMVRTDRKDLDSNKTKQK